VTDPNFVVHYRSATHRLRLQGLQEETRSRAQKLETVFGQWGLADLGVDPKLVGLKGSPTIVAKVEPIPVAPKERSAKIFRGDNAAELTQAVKVIAELAAR
jgi:electron transfer flavoprotein beta subunit